MSLSSISPQFFLDTLAGAMLAIAFYTTSRMRLRSLVLMFAWQSFLLAAFALIAASTFDEPHLRVTALLTFALKTCFLPWFLVRIAERSDTSHRLHAYLRPAPTLLVAGFVVLGACVMTQSLVPFAQTDYLIVASSISVVMLGLLMLVSRKGVYGQIVGFLLMENGIFTFGLALTGGMPLLVELGIFFDVAIGAVLMAALSYRIQREHETVTTDSLTELVD